MFKPSKSKLNINQFISKVNSLYNRASIPFSKYKTILFKHILLYLNLQLLTNLKDTNVSYKLFCSKITNIAKVQELAYNFQSKKRQSTLVVKKSLFRLSTKTLSLKKSFKKNKVSADSKKALQQDSKCFLYYKEGYFVKKCLEQKVIAKVLKKLDEESSSKLEKLTQSSYDLENQYDYRKSP